MKLWESIAGFCQDSASVRRIFQTQSGSDERVTKDSSINSCEIRANSPYESDCSGMTDLSV